MLNNGKSRVFLLLIFVNTFNYLQQKPVLCG